MMAAAIVIVAGCTRIISVNPTSPALVLTNTNTITPTAAVVPSPTPETIQVVADPSSPGSSIQIPGASAIPVLEISATNSGSDPANMTSLKVTASGSGQDASGISAVALYLDANDNGIVDGADTFLTSGTYSVDNGTLTLNFTNTVAASSTAHYLVVYSFSASAPAGTYQATLANNADVTGTNGTTGLSVQVNGAPVNGAVITIVGATNTFTTTATNSPSNTPTNTPLITNTASRTPTNSPTKTPTGTATKTPTPSITNTPPPGSTATNSPTMTPTPSITNTVTKTATTTPTNTPTNTPAGGCTYLLNDAESLSGNGVWSNLYGTVALTTTNATQGTYAIDANITTGNSWNKFAILSSFAPNNFSTATQLIVDINVDATLITGDGGWNQMQLQGNNGAVNLASTNPSLVAGANSVTINITSTGTPLTDLELIYQSGGTPIGHMYVDNLRVVYSGACPATPTMTPAGGCTGLLNDMENFTYNGTWTNENGTVALTTTNATQGTYALDANVTVGNGWNKFAILTGFAPTDFSTATKLIVDINADATLISGDGGWHQMQLQANAGAINLASNSPGLVAGANSVTFNITATGTAITDLEIIYQSGGTPIGHFYVDNLRVAYSGACPSGGAPTNTFTDTPTPAGPTPTPTITNTPGACPLPLSAAYTFDSAIDCWTTTDQLTTTTVDWASAPPAGSSSGGGAFHANVAYSSASQLTEEFEVPLPANTDLTGKVVTFNVYIDNSVKGSAWGGGIQTYIKTSALITQCIKPWVNISGFGSWFTYTMIMDNNFATSPTLTDVRAIGLQIIIANNSGAGNIYIDDVTVSNYVPPTVTPTPNGSLTWTYEDATTQNWVVAAGSSYTPSLAVTNITALNAVASGFNGSTYGLDILLPPVALMNYGNNDVQVECNSGTIIGSGMDWTALNLSSVVVQYCWPTASIGTVYPYVRASGTPHGGTYGGWVDQCNNTGCPGWASTNTWTTVTLTPSAGAWATEKSNVTAVGVDINLGTSTPFGAFAGGDIVIDNITLQ